MFIRKRISPSRRASPSYTLLETYREGGRVKQRVIANLGPHPTVQAALAAARAELEVAWEVVRRSYTNRRAGYRLDRARERVWRLEEALEAWLRVKGDPDAWDREAARQRLEATKLAAEAREAAEQAAAAKAAYDAEIQEITKRQRRETIERLAEEDRRWRDRVAGADREAAA